MKMRQYSEYRDERVGFVEALPAHWEPMRLKYLGNVQLSNVDKKSVEGQVGVGLCNYVDVYKNDCITSDMEFMAATATKAQIERFELRRGDVMLTKDSETPDDIAVPAVVNEDLDGILCGYHLAMVRPKKGNDGRYMARAIAARGLREQFFIEALGVTRFGLGYGAIGAARFPLPPPDEQRKIADFLDRETEKIDGLIAEKEKLIRLLEEKRKAIISDAVTKGLNPDVKMRDSGVPWLGMIPEHWQVKRLRFALQLNPSRRELAGVDRATLVTFLPMDAVSECARICAPQEVAMEAVASGYTYFRNGDILIAKITPCFENGKGAHVGGLRNGIGFGTTEFHVCRPSAELFGQFFWYVTRSRWFRKYGETEMKGTAGQKRVTDDFIKNLFVGIPPLNEQEEIAVALERVELQVDALLKDIARVTALLRERRAALVAAAVTGRIDVSTTLNTGVREATP
jgi:type I restriction enzyme, S subunit